MGITQQRLSEYVLGKFVTYPTNSGIKKAIKKGLVFVNGSKGKTADFISGGETIVILATEEIRKKPQIDIPIQVLYEDDYLIVVNKPAGIEVSGNKKWTLENALLPHVKPSSASDALARPQPVHRLDYPTSGVLVAGKTAGAVRLLNAMFAEKKVQKTYRAITIGKMEMTKGEVCIPVDNKEAHSAFEVLHSVESPRFQCLNLLSLQPFTGRRHQLRKHMAEMGHPILGDLQYGKEGLLLKGKGLYLHAAKIEFQHPVLSVSIVVEAPLPEKYLKIFSQAL